jgi:hypothetical protein
MGFYTKSGHEIPILERAPFNKFFQRTDHNSCITYGAVGERNHKQNYLWTSRKHGDRGLYMHTTRKAGTCIGSFLEHVFSEEQLAELALHLDELMEEFSGREFIGY